MESLITALVYGWLIGMFVRFWLPIIQAVITPAGISAKDQEIARLKQQLVDNHPNKWDLR